jgi:DNA-binding SARP family transcriptional activator/tetratricopeptide (TPR) repeat protein
VLLHIGVLGPLTVLESGREVVLPEGKQRVLLAAVALAAPRTASMDELAEALWDGRPPAAAEPTLRNYVRRLRRNLGDAAGRLETRRGGYRLALGERDLDSAEFEARCREGFALDASAWAERGRIFRAALELWRGEPLAGIESQLLVERHAPRLRQLRLDALGARIDADLHLGGGAGLVPELRELIIEHPLHEPLHGQLMIALAAAGRPAEAIETFHTLRSLLIEELGVEPGPQLRHLHELLLSEQTDLLAERAPPGSGPRYVKGTDGPPRQLPASAGHFLGREAELDRILRWGESAAGPGGPGAVCAINGMGGVGKTALAVHAARRLAPLFPDGQLFLDLRGHLANHVPRAAGECLDLLLQSLDTPPDRIPEDLELRAARYRQRLAGSRTLILLDDVLDEPQVRALLPGEPGCLVLITSRRRLRALDEAYTVPLDPLSERASVELFRQIAGPDRLHPRDPLLPEAAARCGRLPLALRIAAALLRHRPARDLPGLLASLRRERDGVAVFADSNRDLSAVFQLSYEALPQPHRELFRRLGLHPGVDYDPYAAAALVDSDLAAAAGLLDDLVDHNLLVEHAPDRYRLHDLLRSHARALAAAEPGPDGDAAVKRLLDYYGYAAGRAAARVARQPREQPAGPVPTLCPELTLEQTALAWLRTERANLEAGFDHAVARGWDEQVTGMAAGLADLLRDDGPWDRAQQVDTAALRAARRLGEVGTAARALNDLARIRVLTGDYAAAQAETTQALALYREAGDLLGEANALTDLGRVRYVTAHYRVAAEAAARALELFLRLGNRLGQANALKDLGRVRFLTADYPGATEAGTAALELFRELGARHGQASTLTDLGRAWTMVGEHAAAVAATAQSLQLFERLGNLNGMVGALAELGRARIEAGDHGGAIEALVRAAALCTELGSPLAHANVQVHLGRAKLAAGDPDGAAEVLALALAAFRELRSRGNEAWALPYHADALAALGQIPRARADYERGLDLSRQLNQRDDEAHALEGIGTTLLTAHGPGAAAAQLNATAHLNQALDIYRELGMRPDVERVEAKLRADQPARQPRRLR